MLNSSSELAKIPNTEHGTRTFYTWEDILYLNTLPGLLSCSPFCGADVPRSSKRYFTAVFCSFFLWNVSLILNDNLVSDLASRLSLDILYCTMTLSHHPGPGDGTWWDSQHNDPALSSRQKKNQTPCSQWNPFACLVTQIPNPLDNQQGSLTPAEGGRQERKDLRELGI